MPAAQTARFAPLVLVAVVVCGTSCAADRPAAVFQPYGAAPPSAARPWQPADPEAAPAPPPPRFEVVPDPEKVYELSELIDLAQRANPETRRSWEQARAAAARLGLAESAYFPTLVLLASGGWARTESRTTDGPVYTTGPSVSPGVSLTYTLLDFGRRGARVDAAEQELLASNLTFNRKHQEVAFAVQRSFYDYDASRAQVDAALATLENATTVERAATKRLEGGLATRPEVLLARQARARAQYDVQIARRAVSDAQARLAASLGISPALPLRVVDLSALPLPPDLEESADRAIDRALARRPDLAAKLAELRAREAELRRTRAEWLPELTVAGAGGGTVGNFTTDRSGGETFGYAEPVYGAFLRLSWTIFDGFARDNRIREAEARRGEAEAALTVAQVEALREVWASYADVKAALLEVEFADALFAASQEAYDAALKGFQAGMSDMLDLLAAERDLARARSTRIESRASLLRSAAALAFAVGD